MDLSKRILTAGGLSLLISLGAAIAQPQLSIQQEQRSHPRIVVAIRDMHAALNDLREAPHDFGGNKAAAMHDSEVAIHSLKKALYYRLKMDDAAIDRAQ